MTGLNRSVFLLGIQCLGSHSSTDKYIRFATKNQQAEKSIAQLCTATRNDIKHFQAFLDETQTFKEFAGPMFCTNLRMQL